MQMEIVISLVITAVVVVVFGAIFHKMGFSRFTGLLMIVPFVNLLWLLYIAIWDWPIERQLAERPGPDQCAQEDHLTLMFRRAEMFEQRGDYAEALKLFEILAQELEGKPGAHFADHCASRLRKRVGTT